MTDEMSSNQQPRSNPALQASDVMVSVWDLQGRDFTTKEEIQAVMTRVQSSR